jgi:hypothetical protein
MTENIKIVQAGGMMFIGNLIQVRPDDMGRVSGYWILTNPRVVRIGQPNQSGIAQIFLLKIVGNPKDIRIHDISFSYEPDREFVSAYMQDVTGLVMAKNLKVLEGKG